MFAELIRFGCIGGLAMLVHFLVVLILVPMGTAPLAANIAGFLMAFQVSFFGHSRWTFRAHGKMHQYLRLFSVSVLGFSANEFCFALLLRFSSLDHRAALCLVLVGVAGATYLGSKFWVFPKGKNQRTPCQIGEPENSAGSGKVDCCDTISDHRSDHDSDERKETDGKPLTLQHSRIMSGR